MIGEDRRDRRDKRDRRDRRGIFPTIGEGLGGWLAGWMRLEGMDGMCDGRTNQ